ncbi:MAG: nuclear transport factor 2 family protein [Planctomycetota bacterium]|nr:nuclear transport factor 2 family protein [Planctomycetota bacterium]
MSRIETLAARQLEAYNASDLEAFCACYHDEVEVWNDREPTYSGIATFRERYRDLFERWDFGGSVSERLVCGDHAVDLEHWWRTNPDSGERSEGYLLVRYTLREDRIGVVQFIRA